MLKTIDEIYNFKKPETREGWMDLGSENISKGFDNEVKIAKELGFDTTDEDYEPNAVEMQKIVDQPEYQISLAYYIVESYAFGMTKTKEFENDDEQLEIAVDMLNDFKSETYKEDYSEDDDKEEWVTFKVIEKNRVKAAEYHEVLTKELSLITD
ncbi:hypothetical protein [Spiroplasma alleghenense]|uniref:Uncharacterized protein n=1 Tax=Spiroplasma alleghenense TaxID=216931 RepID=A0A345Z511_9MOLU|nr:hypothetical protein [Spiroplasma alleghenense]AXK51690.1 hypothetical protein SALLE_v1c10200 [Spiroplasma alleghenense]